MVALSILGAVSAYGYVQWKLDQIRREQINSLTSINGGKPFTVLIVGSDSRSALSNNSDNRQFGGSSAAPGQRSDTIILARIAPATRQLMLLSLPRDLWVNIPGHGMDRINSAFDTGPDLLVKTIQADLGIPVNHYVEVNFDTFRDVTDAVGGVSFYFPTPAKDAFSLLKVPQAGCVALTGDQALGFVRSRHYEYYQHGSWHFEAESDLARIQRQQAFIKKMIKKAESKFTDIGSLNGVINGITKNLTVDTGFGNTLLLDLARDFHGIDPAGIATLTLPNYSFTTPGGADVLGLQQPQAAQVIAAFNNFGNTPPPATTTTKPPKKTPPPPKINPPSVTVAPSSVSVEVANGDGVGGQAATMNSLLAGKGYHSSVNPLSPGGHFDTTEIRYAPDAKTAAEQIGAAIPGGAKLVESSALTPTAYNVEVITGDSYTTATGGTPAPASSPASTAASSAPTTSPTTLPGTNPDTYVLPGTPPGQVPPKC